VRAIGVSNFMPEHLEGLLVVTSVVPAIQVELPAQRARDRFDHLPSAPDLVVRPS
jgi:diketogulonate reductase-like aldo/keto reductase